MPKQVLLCHTQFCPKNNAFHTDVISCLNGLPLSILTLHDCPNSVLLLSGVETAWDSSLQESLLAYDGVELATMQCCLYDLNTILTRPSIDLVRRTSQGQ